MAHNTADYAGKLSGFDCTIKFSHSV